MSDDNTMISLVGVSCDLGGARILDGIDLELRRGEITVVLGPSGAGKSTLLRAIAGFEPVSAGVITAPSGMLSSTSYTAPPEHRRIGFVVQSFALFPHLTALKNVRFGLDKPSAKDVALRWLERVKLADRADAYPHELSGGEQQRVALARALARRPDVVLLDEAFSSLDQQLRKSVRREAKGLLREAGAAVLAVTHDPDEALELADTIVVLDAGRVVQKGTPEDLFWRPRSVVAARLLGEVNELSGEWENGQFSTAFGTIETSQMASDSAKLALIRPAALSARASKDGECEVIDHELSAGRSTLIIAARNGQTVRVSGQFDAALKVADRVEILFDYSRVGWA